MSESKAKAFRKTAAQVKATKLMGMNYKHMMFYGGSRSGKTFNIIRAIVVRASRVKSRHIVLKLNFNSCKTSIAMDTFPKVMAIAFPDLPYSINRTDMFATLPNGSEIWFGGLDDDKRVEKILGKEYSTIFFNECSQLSYGAVQIALTRLAEKNDLKNVVYYDQNPPPKSHWSYWLFEEKLNPVDEEPLKNPEQYISFMMNPKDNLENIDSEYLEMLENMPEDQRKRFLEGLYLDVDDGQVYYSFRRDEHIKDVVRHKNVTYYIGMDFNVNPMTAVIFQVINNQIQVFDEVYLENSDTPKMIAELKRRGYKGLKVIPDSTGGNRKTSGASDFQLLREANYSIMDVFNPFVTDRVNNVNRLFNLDKIIVDPKCKKLINDLVKVSWKDNKLDQKGSNKMLTHISDALGYGCHRLMPLVKIPVSKATTGKMM